MENKVVYEVRLSKPVMTVAVMAAVGLLAIGAKPLIEATPAFAQNTVQRVQICSPGLATYCLKFRGTDALPVYQKER